MYSTNTHNLFNFSLLRGKSWRSPPKKAVRLHLCTGLVWSPAPNESTAEILSRTDLHWAIILLLLSNIKTWACSLSLPSPVEIVRLSSAIFPPPPWLLGVAVSHIQLSVQPCGFWLLFIQMISYSTWLQMLITYVRLKCHAAGWGRWLTKETIANISVHWPWSVSIILSHAFTLPVILQAHTWCIIAGD